MLAFKRQASIEGPLGARKSDQTEPISACSLTIGHPAEPTSPAVAVRLRKRILVSHQGRLAASRNRVAYQPQPHLRGRRIPRRSHRSKFSSSFERFGGITRLVLSKLQSVEYLPKNSSRLANIEEASFVTQQ